MRLGLFIAACVCAAASWAASSTPQITAVRAQLFYESSGELSGDLFAETDLALWNTIIGEKASSATLVTVEVSGKDVGVGDVKVEVIAMGPKNKVIGKTVMDVALYDQKTKFYAPLMLIDTGCDAVKISARLTGKGVAKTVVTKTIPFACGE